MEDIDNLQSRLAHEEETLAATHDQIRAAHGNIEALRKQIEDTQRQIAGTEEHIEKLKEHTATIEKRIALLREYIEMVQTGAEPVPLPETTQPEPVSGGEELDSASDAGDVELEIVPPASAPTDAEAPSTEDAGPITLETIDEEHLTTEVLPRTQTFAEELLLVLAYHRKAVAAKDVARLFRRLDYAPKLSPTSKNVKTQVETDRDLFEFATGDKIALTREGRSEAQKLLGQLL